ncbi:hypothetical protein [Undibacterium sp. Ji22W]|uniref:hypothetical protein n=1 Tax=Undibacterium sp. Ji22W TaxID=3413038 RepID=UPI003BF1C3E8
MQRLSIFLVLILALLAKEAIACKLAPKGYDLKVFLASREPGQVVFLGKVISIDPIPSSSSSISTQKISFQVSRWWRGQARDVVIAIGVQGSAKGTSCEGVFDFSAKIGQEFLVVGYEENGEIRPSKQLSKELEGDKLTKDILALLGEEK